MRDDEVVDNHPHLVLVIQDDAVLTHPADGKIGRVESGLPTRYHIGRVDGHIEEIPRYSTLHHVGGYLGDSYCG